MGSVDVEGAVRFGRWLAGAEGLRDEVLAWKAGGDDGWPIESHVVATGMVVDRLNPVDAYLVCYLQRHKRSIFNGADESMADGIEFRFRDRDRGECRLYRDGELKGMAEIQRDAVGIDTAPEEITDERVVQALISNMYRLYAMPHGGGGVEDAVQLPSIGRAFGLTTKAYGDLRY